ncbi:tetratricopeptide repeat protein [Nonomuraea sp. NPDC048892]|uniref:tetratricopeptide repeat protein n=1 Tax=Nonomuraea sp. NPDC048892 TaxID=3154624 RepID=UPI0033DBD913
MDHRRHPAGVRAGLAALAAALQLELAAALPSEALAERATAWLADLEGALGADHPSTLISRNNLAHAYQSAGDLGRAIPLHERTLADRERVLGADHPTTRTVRDNLRRVAARAAPRPRSAGDGAK